MSKTFRPWKIDKPLLLSAKAIADGATHSHGAEIWNHQDVEVVSPRLSFPFSLPKQPRVMPLKPSMWQRPQLRAYPKRVRFARREAQPGTAALPPIPEGLTLAQQV
jgi:hypothetical protein